MIGITNPHQQHQMIAEQEKTAFQQTEVGEIPSDWNLAKLSEIVNFENGKAHEQFIDRKGNFTVVNSKFISTEGEVAKFSNKNLSLLLKGDITIVMSDIPNGKALAKCFFIDKDNLYTLNQRIGGMRSNPEVNNRYLFYKLNRNKYFLSFDSGSGQTNLRKNQLLDCLVPLPPTLTEQTAIATALTDADALITQLEKLIAKKKAIKQGAMQELLKPKERWEVKTLGEVANVTKLAGFEYSKYFNSYKDGGDIIVIRGTNLTNNKLDLTDIKKIPYSTSKNLQRSKLSKNDLVFAYVGTIGPVYLIEENDKYHLGPNTAKITVKGFISPQYLLLYFKSAQLKNEMFENISVGAQPSLSMTKIRSFKIAFPTDTDSQTRIAQILSDMDAEIEKLEQRLAKQKMLKQGMMQVLLTGKIRLV